MNENPDTRPYHELPRMDHHCRPLLSDAWEYPRWASTEVPVSGPLPLPVGPGTFLLPFMVHEMIKTLEVEYHFKAGREAAIQAAEEGAPVYRICAPGGYVIIPVGAVRQWVIHLPAGTQVRAFIAKWQKDIEKMARRPKPVMTPELLERGRKALAEIRERRRPFPDAPETVEEKKKAEALYKETVAAINAQFVKEMKEKEKRGN